MGTEISRRTFVKETVAASAGTAMVLGTAAPQASAAEPPKPPARKTPCPRERSATWR